MNLFTQNWWCQARPGADGALLALKLNPLLVESRETSLAPAVQGELPGGVKGVVGHLNRRYRIRTGPHHPDVAGLDALCEATAYVAERIRRECEE